MILRELYQELILDHGKRPRNFAQQTDCTHSAEGYNPLCGDHFFVYFTIEDGTIVNAHFHGNGCAISTASASLMTQALKGESTDNARALFKRVHALLTGTDDPGGPELGKLAVFEGVRTFPLRVKCATLAWHTLIAALDDKPSVAITE